MLMSVTGYTAHESLLEQHGYVRMMFKEWRKNQTAKWERNHPYRRQRPISKAESTSGIKTAERMNNLRGGGKIWTVHRERELCGSWTLENKDYFTQRTTCNLKVPPKRHLFSGKSQNCSFFIVHLVGNNILKTLWRVDDGHGSHREQGTAKACSGSPASTLTQTGRPAEGSNS